MSTAVHTVARAVSGVWVIDVTGGVPHLAAHLPISTQCLPQCPVYSKYSEVTDLECFISPDRERRVMGKNPKESLFPSPSKVCH